MRTTLSALGLLLLSGWYCQAQQVSPLNPSDMSSANIAASTRAARDERRAQIDYLQQASLALKKYLSTKSKSGADRTAQITVQDIDAKLESLIKLLDTDGSSAPASTVATEAGSSAQDHPEFSLAVPQKGRTNISTETTLTWTEDRRNGAFQNPPLYNLKRFHVVVARDENFRQVVVDEPNVTPASAKVTPNTQAPNGLQSIATSFTIPADRLEPGTRYYWRVLAVYTPEGQPTVDSEQEGRTRDGRPSFFITTIDPFHPLTKRNFSLQRTVDSTDPTEGAQFSFLKTFGGKTVYSSEFAFFWDSSSRRFANNRGFVWFRPAVEAKLTSDKSTSEDAWRFSGSAVVDYNFIDLDGDSHNRIRSGTNVSAPRRFIDGLYFELGGSLESDQGFETRKLASRIYVSPSSRKLAIGTATGHPDSPVQFVWRPSFEFNAGHTFEPGDSAETGKTILRMVPKVRMTLYTRALSRLLKVANSDIFVDNTFYYLPNDLLKKRHNMFTSGFELLFLKNFGFGLTYKSGESAPKFKRVNSFGGVLTVRFGPE